MSRPARAASWPCALCAVPPDANHPYGHHKVEYLSVVMEGVLIVVAALVILRKAYLGYSRPAVISAPALGLAINGLATVINAVWCFILIRVGRKRRSPALLADARHLFTDVITSAGVFSASCWSPSPDGWCLDSLIAALVALNILWSGWG